MLYLHASVRVFAMVNPTAGHLFWLQLFVCLAAGVCLSDCCCVCLVQAIH